MLVDNTTESERADSLAQHYAVRVGLHGQVGRFQTSEGFFRRGSRVICRTARGLEAGTILNRLNQSHEIHSITIHHAAHAVTDGVIVRRMVAEDLLLWRELQKLAQQAHAACQHWLEETGSGDVLLEVEPLLDGRTLYFHFLSDASHATEAQLGRLVSIFQETVTKSDFARLLEHGCGPGCGTEAATRGCGSACASCAVKCR